MGQLGSPPVLDTGVNAGSNPVIQTIRKGNVNTHIVLLMTKDNWSLYTTTLKETEYSSRTYIENFELLIEQFGLKVEFLGYLEVTMTQPIPGLPVPPQEYPFVEANTFTELVIGPPADDDNDLD